MKGTSRKAAAGFTLVELLVVIAIILVLGAMVFMGMGRAAKAAHKAESINNIKQLSAITMAEASDNAGVFPEMHYDELPFRFSYEWREDAGITRDMVYSSANKCWTKDGIDVCSGAKRDLWEFGGERVSSLFSYICMVNDNGWADEGNFTVPDNWVTIEKRVTVDEGTPEAQVRWLLERTNQEVAYPILWLDQSMSWNNQRLGNFMTNRNRDPEGVHVGYMDSSVVWISGPQVRARYSSPGLVIYW